LKLIEKTNLLFQQKITIYVSYYIFFYFSSLFYLNFSNLKCINKVRTVKIIVNTIININVIKNAIKIGIAFSEKKEK